MNYTQPNSKEHEDKPEQWLDSALIFAQALGTLLQPDSGIVVDLQGDVSIREKHPQVIVWNDSESSQISVSHTSPEDNLQHGAWVKMSEK